jgi:hypothetical protein
MWKAFMWSKPCGMSDERVVELHEMLGPTSAPELNIYCVMIYLPPKWRWRRIV